MLYMFYKMFWLHVQGVLGLCELSFADRLLCYICYIKCSGCTCKVLFGSNVTEHNTTVGLSEIRSFKVPLSGPELEMAAQFKQQLRDISVVLDLVYKYEAEPEDASTELSRLALDMQILDAAGYDSGRLEPITPLIIATKKALDDYSKMRHSSEAVRGSLARLVSLRHAAVLPQ